MEETFVPHIIAVETILVFGLKKKIANFFGLILRKSIKYCSLFVRMYRTVTYQNVYHSIYLRKYSGTGRKV